MKAILRAVFAALLVLAITVPAPGKGDEGNDVVSCYSVRGEARYGAFAYKHVVVVTNQCKATLQCEVWTDVDPSPKHSLNVEPNGSGEVIVRNNSPARSFKAFAECKK